LNTAFECRQAQADVQHRQPRPHHAYLFANRRADRMKVLVRSFSESRVPATTPASLITKVSAARRDHERAAGPVGVSASPPRLP
jgi:hypothetical protein